MMQSRQLVCILLADKKVYQGHLKVRIFLHLIVVGQFCYGE